jgi:hypothetical protein
VPPSYCCGNAIIIVPHLLAQCVYHVFVENVTQLR